MKKGVICWVSKSKSIAIVKDSNNHYHHFYTTQHDNISIDKGSTVEFEVNYSGLDEIVESVVVVG
jgi:predicted LPLAT superfamily acyltransferase